MRWVILGNGPLADYAYARQLLHTNDRVICCDGGIRHAYALGVMPTVVLGDFDSVDPALAAYYRCAGVVFETFPVEKDYTDMELAVKHAMDSGARELLILGGLGARLDHTLANMQLLLLALDSGVAATLADERNAVRVMSGEMVIEGPMGSLVSLVPADGVVTGVVTEGLYYPLRSETLKPGQSRGVSNVMIGERAVVRASSGRLFVIQSTE